MFPPNTRVDISSLDLGECSEGVYMRVHFFFKQDAHGIERTVLELLFKRYSSVIPDLMIGCSLFIDRQEKRRYIRQTYTMSTSGLPPGRGWTKL